MFLSRLPIILLWPIAATGIAISCAKISIPRILFLYSYKEDLIFVAMEDDERLLLL